MKDAAINELSLQRCLEFLAQALEAAISSMSGLAVKVAVERASEGAAELLAWEQALEYPAGGRVWIGGPPATWKELGGAVLREAGLDPNEEEQRGTYLELLAQAMSGFSQSLVMAAGRAVACLESKTVPGLPRRAPGFSLQVSIGDAQLPPLVVEFSTEFEDLWRTKPAAPAEAVETRAAAPTDKYKGFDLLLDVELPVSVSFGRAELPLKDVIKLTTGSIVELNRSLSEPVEILVNNCVIARGGVVVIDGNYGVRIDQIISRQERLRTLR